MKLAPLALLAAVLTISSLSGSEPADGGQRTVAELVDQLRPSLATIRFNGRDGNQVGIGTAFVISSDGLLATNLHVIGEGRVFTVEMADGSKPKVLAIEASDRLVDLALIRVEVDPANPLQAISLRQDKIRQGAAVVAMGNPLGLLESVVTGVVSAVRNIDGRELIQLAMPVEMGNSGGPVVDMNGNVAGIVNMKSAVQQNIAFAVQVDALKLLIDRPNAVSVDNWTRMGGLDRREWTPLFGARWRQRNGQIQVSGSGEGFGGRSLCLATQETPPVPFEVGVTVRLGDESGAAGLVFHSDGNNRHYGFYPSNGKLRLSCFKGPVVFSWQVLGEKASVSYRRSDWNELRVRVEAERIQCFANNELIFESRDRTFSKGQVGLAKFRQTAAEFREFQVGPTVASRQPASDELEKASGLVETTPPLDAVTDEYLATLGGDTLATLTVLNQKAQRLLAEAEELRTRANQLERLASDVRLRSAAQQLAATAAKGEEMDLLRAALEAATLEDPEVNVASYLTQVDKMASQIKRTLPEDASEDARFAALNRFLFKEQGYHGSRFEYYHRANSLMNRVIDDREGLPITLSILYMELGRRVGLRIEGVGLPGHFVVRWLPSEGDSQLVDVFNGGRPLTPRDAEELVGEPLADQWLKKSTKRAILERMLRNLLNVAEGSGDGEAKLRCIEGLVAVRPVSVQYRGLRAVVRSETGRRAAALADLDWIIEANPTGIDLNRIREMREFFRGR